MEENSTNTTTETKTNWFKSHMTICIVSAVAVIAVVVALVLILGNKGGQSPEEVAKTYVAAMQEGNADKLMNITDVKGACAWAKCGRNASKFEETYNSISDEDAKAYEKTFKTAIEATFKLAKIEMSIKNIEKPEEIAKNLFKVKASVKAKFSVFGVEQEQDQDISLVVYNGRFIGEAK